MSFMSHFKSPEQIIESKDKKKKPKAKITKNFEDELRQYFKIKDVVYSSFGVQIDFYKKVSEDEIRSIIDNSVKIKFKEKSIFIEF